jgi:hypothetical protein
MTDACSTATAPPFFQAQSLKQIDPISQIIKVRQNGFPTLADVKASYELARRFVRDCRRRGQIIRILVEHQGGTVYSAEAAEWIRATARSIYREGDLIAIFATSSLARLQLRRVYQSNTHAVFATEAEAIAWLLSHG